MILLVHMLFGAAIGASIKIPSLALALAFLGHYFLDIFPHIEYLEEGAENSVKKISHQRPQESVKILGMIFIDFCLGFLFIFLASKNQPVIYLCALAAIVPDGMTVIHLLFPKLGLGLHHHLHGTKIHYLTKQKKFPKFWRVFTQVIAAAVSIILLNI